MKRAFVRRGLCVATGSLVGLTLLSAARAQEPDAYRLAEKLAEEEYARWSLERDERYGEAIDPGEGAEHARRFGYGAMLSGKVKVAELFRQGETIFDRQFTRQEGMGTGALTRPAPALSRVQNTSLVGGPDALSCRECHGRGGEDGHGELHQRAWLDGDGRHLRSAKPRVPPHLAGVGLTEALAAEMTVDLQAAIAVGRRAVSAGAAVPFTVKLVSKGVEFGVARVLEGGRVDVTDVRSVDADLVVRPFGWKGTIATLRAFVTKALPQHMGLEPLPARPGSPSPRDFEDAETHAYLHDADNDGVAGEVLEGQVVALTAYLALQDVPVTLPPRSPALREALRQGQRAFREIGCAGCHRPTLPLRGTTLAIAPPGIQTMPAIDLVADNQVAPVLERRDYSRGLAVPIYSDLRRHDLGSAVGERKEGGATESEFLTRPLWGLGDRGAYFMHDGAARSVAEAVARHGGEAATAAAAYRALHQSGRRGIDVLIVSLRRAPQGRLRP